MKGAVMAKFPRLAGVNHALKGTVILLLLATSLPSAAESDYLVGLRQSSLLNAGEGLVEGDSQEQLRQLKQAFLALAMEREARVAASGWTNSDGAMGEDVMVFSDVQLERLRPTLRRDRFGREVAELVYASGTAEDATENAACVAQPLRPQRLSLKVAVDTSGSAQTANMARSAATLLRDQIKAAYDEDRLAGVSTLITGPVRSGNSAGTRQSAYHRYMTEGPRSTADMELRLRVSAQESQPTLQRVGLWRAARSGMRVQVEADLITAQGSVLPLETSIFVGSTRQSSQDQLAWLTLPKSAHQTLAQWLDEALVEIGAGIGCHGETALTLAMNAEQLTLNGGFDAGIYRGQRLAILPTSRHLNARGLESAMGVVSLARVVRVTPRNATLEVYAGAADLNASQMMAIPMAALAL
ncbi:MAG: hypothetical protein CMD51_01255 [Gammaproteobacteria bacterium]|nr:hypothetical protein [Gammaproteobacteria bacterium]